MMNYEATIRQFFAGKGGRYSAWIAIGVLVILIAVTLYQTVTLFFEPSKTAGRVPQDKVNLSLEDEEKQRLQALIHELPNIHLFGTAAEGYLPPLQQTTLKLTLQGIMQGGDQMHSAAIIGEGGGPGKAYHVGDSLPGGATLEEILSHSVILRRNDVREELILPRRELPVGLPPKPLFDK